MFDFIENTLINADIFRRKLIERINSEDGASFTEYIILIAIIAGVVFSASKLLSGAIGTKASDAVNIIGSADFNP